MWVLLFLLRPRVRWVICWLVLLASASIAAVEAWKGFNDSDRGDGNSGHATIDFGGQWLMGRMIVEGQGRHLYLRNYLRPLAQHWYPESDEKPREKKSNGEKSDAENLMDWLAGGDDPKAAKAVASLLSPLAANNVFDETVVLASAQSTWTEERLKQATAPQVGGALYPPIHALYYAPVARLPPRVAYRLVQGIVLGLALFAGWVVQRISEGRVWWPIASLFVLMFPSFSGCIALGQNGIIILTLALLGWWQLMRGREVLAGLFWGLLAFKPVWAVALFLVPLLTTRWRMAASMAVVGIVQILMTLPIVGWESWLNWLKVGQGAAQEYKRQENWIFLSRDLLGIPRRWLLTFEGSLAKDVVWRSSSPLFTVEGVSEKPWDDPLLDILGWGLWATVLGFTLYVAWRCRQRNKELTGHYPAFVLMGAVFCCYHFMYYDFLVAGLPVLLLFTEPRRYLQVQFWQWPGRRKRSEPSTSEVSACSGEMLRYYQPPLADLMPPPMPLLPGGRRWRWVRAPLPPLLLLLILALPAISCILDPTYHSPPWETLLLLVLWGWCGYHLLQNPFSDATQKHLPLQTFRAASLTKDIPTL